MAPKWSSSPRTPAARFAAAATWGWPPSHPARASAVATSSATTAARYARKAWANAGVFAVTVANRLSRSWSTAEVTVDSLACASDESAATASDWSVNSHESSTARNALAGIEAVRSTSVMRRYTVSSRCSGVSVSEICTSATAKPRSQRALPQEPREERLPGAILTADGLER